MHRPIFQFMALTSIISSAALAHDGVQNTAVKARMDDMGLLATEVKTLGQMMRGQTAFDADAANAAAAAIAAHAAQIVPLFEANETDPKSEALPAIWQDFDSISEISANLENVATALSGNINEAADLRMALGRIGQTCSACHEKFRLEQ